MSVFQKPRTKASARAQVAIEGARDGVLILPHGRYRAILEVSSLNFELKSEEEQDAIMETYESFLNSVGTPLQIIIRTREVDMDGYLEEIRGRSDEETEPVYREQLGNYGEFIRSLVQSNKILTRRFYVVVPYDAPAKADFAIAKEQLDLRADIVAKGMMRLGMQAVRLTSLEVLDLFYGFYNPRAAKAQPLTERALSLIHTELTKGGIE